MIVGGVLLAGSMAEAVFVDERLADPAEETRAREISEGIRCLVCQNQSIMDSNADLARDLRGVVRERVAAGDTDDQVRDYLVVRYGDWVLLNPPFKMKTALLWVGPAVIFLLGGLAAIAFLRRRSSAGGGEAVQRLSPEEQEELDRLLRDGKEDDRG
nr:cytochrome c-type biogenesis protein [Sneathiella chinensis]